MIKPWVWVVGGVVLGGGVAAAGIAMMSRPEETPKAKTSQPKAAPKDVTLDEGTAIEFLLLQPLHSGDIDVGERAQIVVTSDIKSSGAVVIPAGSVAEVEVVRSREGSVMSSLINQPARLEIKFLPMEIDEATIQLAVNRDNPDAVLELTRKTTSKDEASAALKQLWEKPETQEFLVRLSERLNGDSSDDLDDAQSRKIMREVAAQLDLEATKKAMKDDTQSLGAMLLATQKASQGDFSHLNSTETLLAFQAITELSHIANGVDRGLRGKIKGRNIKIPIGTRLTAYTIESVTVLR